MNRFNVFLYSFIASVYIIKNKNTKIKKISNICLDLIINRIKLN